ncbi:MAG: HTTM domain-containing protein [Actinobacteria bacterium]|nr:HTTM domain-containing protein [Actinomycetota bacterium]
MLTATAPADTTARASWHARPVHAASTAVFRIAFGLVVAVSMVRFVAKGWVESLYLAPTHHLTYARFEWVRPLPGPVMYAVMVVLAATGIGIAVGWRTRACALVFTAGFAYTELIEASLYLNHYWFVTLAGLLVVLLPTDRYWSVDAWRGRVARSGVVPAGVVWALRAQIAVVYVFAGVAKINVDWMHGLPMRMWFADRADVAVIGPLLGTPGAALAASWFGLLFDTTIVGWLLWQRSRPIAYVVVIAFHAVTGVLFRIGMFPWVMVVATLVFFDPSWPHQLWRRITGRLASEPVEAVLGSAPRLQPIVRCALVALAAVELVLPLRHLVEPGDVRVTEEGYYLSWRVMLTEKSALLDFVVSDPTTGEQWIAEPTLVLTDWQAAQAAIRPDLLLATAHLVDGYYRDRLGHDVEVRARSFVSINGRAPQPLADPTIDLSAVSRTTPLHRIVVDP